MSAHRDALRILDANGNRAAEGLRVLEDVARFLCDDVRASEMAKDMRHAVRHAIPAEAVAARDSRCDVGQALANADGVRIRLVDLVRANSARVQEALRAAEEAARLCATSHASSLEALRYRSYSLESALLSRLPAWLLHRVRLYVLVDAALCADPVGIARAAARGGAGAIQLRAKALGVRAYHELAIRVQEAVRSEGGLFIVNDHAAVARAIGADGIHVGQDDLPCAAVRQVVGPGCALGISAHSPEQAIAAAAAGADYLGLGPMFPTATKPHEPAQGPQLLDALRGRITLPSYAIGGIDLERLQLLRPRLLHGVAVAAAVCRAPDPQDMAERMHRVLEPEDA
jgi:thiamine-phosphate pyrophosphorylase